MTNPNVPLRDAFPPNSEASKKDSADKMEAVAKGTVREPSLAKKTRRALFSSDMKDVGSYLLWDIAIPAVKQTIADVAVGGVERALFGDSAPRRSSRLNLGSSRISYTSFSNPTRLTSESRSISRIGRSSFNFSEILLNDRVEAMEVIERMRDRLDRYELVTVADLYDLCGISSNYTDQNWGWTRLEDLRTATYQRVRDGYILVLPEPISVK